MTEHDRLLHELGEQKYFPDRKGFRGLKICDFCESSEYQEDIIREPMDGLFVHETCLEHNILKNS